MLEIETKSEIDSLSELNGCRCEIVGEQRVLTGVEMSD